jgi:hypothetical protein
MPLQRPRLLSGDVRHALGVLAARQVGSEGRIRGTWVQTQVARPPVGALVLV